MTLRAIPSASSSRAPMAITSTSASGSGEPNQLDADLVELTQTALLRPLVTEHRPVVEQLQRQMLGQAAADQRPHDAGGVLRPQRDALAAAVLESVHLLGDDVRRLAERAVEHLGELEDRRRDLAIAVALGERPGPWRRRADGGAAPRPAGRGCRGRVEARSSLSCRRAQASTGAEARLDIASRRSPGTPGRYARRAGSAPCSRR